MRRPGLGWRLALPGVVLVGLLAGCVQMPDDGPIVTTRSGGDTSSGIGTSFDPKPPQKGDTRPDIVKGFLAAMQATPGQTRTAKEFLTKDAAASWDPQRETITYGSNSTPRETDAGVSVTLTDANRLDARGAWQGPVPRGQRTLEFPMSFEDGEWRIDRAPDALVVSDLWFEGRFRQESVYFFDPTASILEAEPVYVPRGEKLASALTQALLLGPSADLRHVAQTFLPPGLKVAVGVAVSPDGVADVSLDGDAGQLTPQTTELMMAQLAWTLRQEPAIESIRLSIGGDPVPLPGGVSSYRVDGGGEYDPAGYQSSPLLYGLRGGVVVSGTAADGLEPVEGPLGRRDYGLGSIGVSLDAGSVAGTGGDGASVLVGELGASGASTVRSVVSDGTDFLRPAWDVAGRIWLVDRTASGARVSFVQGDRPRSLRVPGISGEEVRMFLVSRDGTRLVAVVRRRAGDLLMVSRIEHGGNGRVIGATPAERIGSTAATDIPIRAIAWRTSTNVAVLSAFTSSLAQVEDASVDGSPPGQEMPSATIEGRLRALAGSPASGESLYGISRTGLVDITGSDRRAIPLEKGTTGVVYVG